MDRTHQQIRETIFFWAVGTFFLDLGFGITPLGIMGSKLNLVSRERVVPWAENGRRYCRVQHRSSPHNQNLAVFSSIIIFGKWRPLMRECYGVTMEDFKEGAF